MHIQVKWINHTHMDRLIFVDFLCALLCNRSWKSLRYSACCREVTSWRRGWGRHARRLSGPWLDSSWTASSPPPWSGSSGSSWSQQWLQSCLQKNRGISCSLKPCTRITCFVLHVLLSAGDRVLVVLRVSHLPSLITCPQPLCIHFTSPHSRGLRIHQLLKKQSCRREQSFRNKLLHCSHDEMQDLTLAISQQAVERVLMKAYIAQGGKNIFEICRTKAGWWLDSLIDTKICMLFNIFTLHTVSYTLEFFWKKTF